MTAEVCGLDGLRAPELSTFLVGPGDGAKATWTGTHRTRPLAETARLAEGCLHVAGVSRVADITGLDRVGVPVWNSIRPDADPDNLTVTCGKGLSELAARTSAMMEAIERYCGERNGRRGVLASFAELSARRTVLHPSRLVLDRDHRWTPDTVVEWWPTVDLFGGREVWVPAAAVFTPYTDPPRLIGAASDGLAAGNCAPEALLHALYELVERDCTAFGETLDDRRKVALDTLPAPAAGVVAALRRAGVEPHVFVFETEVGIPTFYTLLDDPISADPLLMNGGAGCHLDPEVAVCRALTEAAQSRLSVISGAREDLARSAYRRDWTYRQARQVASTWFDAPESVDFAAFADLGTASIGGDLEAVLARIRAAGLPAVLATDVTMPGIPFAVVRAIVPGFEFFHEERGRVGARLLRALVERNKVTRRD